MRNGFPLDHSKRPFGPGFQEFRDGAAFRETDERLDYPTLITDLLSGQYSQVLRVVAFNPSEGWSRDASEDIARELERHASSGCWEIAEGLQDFIEGQLGRKIGVQLPLPLLPVH